MYVHRSPTMETALWLMLTASILFAGNTVVGGIEWKWPSFQVAGHAVPHSFAIAFTTEFFFWLVLPTAAGILCRSPKSALKICLTVALITSGLYVVLACNNMRIFGLSDDALMAQLITLSALFGPMLALEVPANMGGSDDALHLMAIYGVWLGFFFMACDKIIGSMQSKPDAASTPAP